MMKQQDDLSWQQSQKGLIKLDLQSSRDACALIRFVYLLCGFLGLAMLYEKYFHLGMLRQSLSLLLMAAQIYAMSWIHFTQNKALPSLSNLYSNRYLSVLLMFHAFTIFGFSWNIFAYILLAAFIVWLQIKRKNQVNKDYVYLSILTIALASLIAFMLIAEGTINIGWSTIAIMIGALLFILQICPSWLIFQELGMYFKLIKIPVFQIIISYATINMPVLAFFVYLSDTFISGQTYCSIVEIYTTISFTLFALSIFYIEEFAVLFCKDPTHLYRCTHTTFQMDGDFKRRNRKQWHISDCVLCHKQPANIWFYNCKCLPYCYDCYSKVKSRRYVKCPICKNTLHFPFVVEFEPWQWQDYRLKFHINCKITANEYLINRKLDR